MSENKVKASLSELDRSNMSGSTQRPVSSSSTRHSDASKSESGKQKPQFIVKKVGTEELFKNQLRANGLIGLSQINEENTADLDDLLPPRPATGVNHASKSAMNIFQTEMVNSEKYKETLKGPAYKDGHVVRHSIVGSTDMFERYQRLQHKIAKENGGLESLGDLKGLKNNKQQHNLSSQDGISMSFSERPNTRGTFLSNRHSELAEKKNAKNELKLSKEEIVNEITKIKERQDLSSREQARATAKRPLSSKLYVTKEERNLEKFDNTNNYWQRTVEDLSHKIGREEGSSLMVTSGKFREKKELVEILDIIQTDEERYGSKIWYNTLRKSTAKPIVKGTSTASLPSTDEAFQTTQIQRQVASLEFIRKPILMKTPAEANPPAERPSSRSDGRYLEDKLVARKHILKEIQPAEVEDIHDLAVKGKNKLKLEAEAILRHAHKKEAVQVPKNFHERKQANNQEETIVKGRTKGEILRNGLNVFIN